MTERTAPLAVFRVDASIESGAGHVMRCLALADTLASAGWSCALASRPGTVEAIPAKAPRREVLELAAEDKPAAMRARWPEGCDLLAVDHYGLDAAFESGCRPWARRILAIDDLADRPHDCDLLLDQTLGRTAKDYAGLVPENCRLLLGPDYALLRSRFAAARSKALARRRQSGPVRRILVSLGAMDVNNATERVLEAIALAGTDAVVDVVLGAGAPHLGEVKSHAREMGQRVTVHTGVEDMTALMARADLAIGAAGITSWERCCLGLPTIAVVIADNQRLLARRMEAHGCIHLLGWHADVTAEDIARAVIALASDARRRLRMSQASAAICDGTGAARVAERIKGMWSEETRWVSGAYQ